MAVRCSVADQQLAAEALLLLRESHTPPTSPERCGSLFLCCLAGHCTASILRNEIAVWRQACACCEIP